MQGQGQGPSLQGQGLDLQGQGQGLDSQGPGQGKDLNLVLKDFTYSYLLQFAAKPTIAIKQQQ